MPDNLLPHILYLPRWYPNRYDPMLGLFIMNHARVAAEFVRVSVLYVHAVRAKDKGYELEEMDDQGIFTLRVYYSVSGRRPAGGNIYGKLINAYRFFKANRIGYRHIKKQVGNPDIIHVHVLTRLGIIALLLKCFKGTPYIVTEHWSRYLPTVNTYKGFIRKQLTRCIIRHASVVTTPTENLKNAMLRHHLMNENYVILPNVVDTERFVLFKEQLPEIRVEVNQSNNEQTARQNGIIGNGEKKNGRKKRIVHVSCFENRSKNISGILNVLKKLSEIRDDWECKLVGKGTDLELMIRRSEDLGLKDYINFTGLLQNEGLVKAVNSADFMVMFSNYENMPVVINEAFSCGVPVISSAVGGIPEFVNEERGVLVKVADEDDLLEKILWMLDHFGDFDKDKIRGYAVSNFSNEAVEGLLKRIYKSSLKNMKDLL